MVLRIASFIFVAKLFTFTLFVFCRFFSVSIPRFYCLSGCSICFFLCCRAFLLLMLCYDVLCALFHLFLLIFLLISYGCFFCLFCLVWINFNLLVLVVFCVVTYILPSVFCYRHTKLTRTPFFLPIFPSHDPIWPPQPSLSTSCFFSPWHTSQNKHDTTIYAYFPVVFRSTRVPAPHCTHKNP